MSTLLSDQNGKLLRIEHSRWLMFEYKKGFSLQSTRELELWDFPLMSLGKKDQHDFSDINVV